jgi:hypothetical protein
MDRRANDAHNRGTKTRSSKKVTVDDDIVVVMASEGWGRSLGGYDNHLTASQHPRRRLITWWLDCDRCRSDVTVKVTVMMITVTVTVKYVTVTVMTVTSSNLPESGYTT